MQTVVDFVIEIDKLKRVTRKTRPTGLDRYENVAEHSWQIALLAASLEPHAETKVDIARVIRARCQAGGASGSRGMSGTLGVPRQPAR